MKEIESKIQERKQAAIREAAPYLAKQSSGERSDEAAIRKLEQSPDYENIKDAFAKAFGLEN